MPDLKSLPLHTLKETLTTSGEQAYRAKQIYEWLHQHLVESFTEMTNLPKSTRDYLSTNYTLPTFTPTNIQESKADGTRKYIFTLSDKNHIESVFMKYKHGNSVCISSQVGCRMGCTFCASAIGGLVRSLTTGEMLEQIYAITRHTDERISNVVVMGIGEPLDNYDELIIFIKMLSDENGLNISQRHITVSSCGLVPEIYKLAEDKLQINLALSLHSAMDEKRTTMMPINKAYPVMDVIKACQYYFEKTGRRLTFEYSLINGVNDSIEDAMALKDLIFTFKYPCHVNLIPLNPVKERDFQASLAKKIKDFKNTLEKYQINVTIRREMGRDIEGACGQLRNMTP